MRKIAIINQKGGSGKTTTAVNLAATLAEKRRRVLVVDLDPQASTTYWFGFAKTHKGLFDAFTENLKLGGIITPTNVKNVDLIPSSSWLIGLEKVLSREVGAEIILRERLNELNSARWDYVLLDCPPALGMITINALSAVNEILVPVETRIMAVNGLVHLLQTIDVIKKRLNPHLKIAGILPCRLDIRTRHAKEVTEELRTNFSGMVYRTAIRENIRLSEASSFGKPITEYATNCNGSADYRALALELMEQEQKAHSTAT